MALEMLLVFLPAIIGSTGVFAAIYWDASRIEMRRPQLWAGIAAVPILLGIGLFVFTSAPTTGVIMTANTGLVLYAFERGISIEDEEPAEPGELPHRD